MSKFAAVKDCPTFSLSQTIILIPCLRYFNFYRLKEWVSLIWVFITHHIYLVVTTTTLQINISTFKALLYALYKLEHWSHFRILFWVVNILLNDSGFGRGGAIFFHYDSLFENFTYRSSMAVSIALYNNILLYCMFSTAPIITSTSTKKIHASQTLTRNHTHNF